MHLNQIQVIGSHNSYHAGFAPARQRFGSRKVLMDLKGSIISINHLTQQFDSGVRQIELDVFADSKGAGMRIPMAGR